MPPAQTQIPNRSSIAVRLWLAAVGMPMFFALCGCVVGPKYHTPSAPVSNTYKESPTNFPEDQQNWKVAAPQDAMLRGKWWEIFNDLELNALEEQIDTNNQNIAQAYQNYMSARSIVREARSQYYPTVSTSPVITRSRASSNLGSNVGSTNGGGGVTSSAAGQAVSFFSLPFSASWEPDLWGRIRNTVNQARYNAQVGAADLENVRLTQQASLAELYFEVRGQDALQKLFDDTVVADKKTVDYAQAQYEVGVGDRISYV